MLAHVYAATERFFAALASPDTLAAATLERTASHPGMQSNAPTADCITLLGAFVCTIAFVPVGPLGPTDVFSYDLNGFLFGNAVAFAATYSPFPAFPA